MKRIINAILIAVFLIGMVGCESKTPTEENSRETTTQIQENSQEHTTQTQENLQEATVQQTEVTIHLCSYVDKAQCDVTVWTAKAITGIYIENLVVVERCETGNSLLWVPFYDDVYGPGFTICFDATSPLSYNYRGFYGDDEEIKTRELYLGKGYIDVDARDVKLIQCEEGETPSLEYHVVYQNVVACDCGDTWTTDATRSYFYWLLKYEKNDNFILE